MSFEENNHYNEEPRNEEQSSNIEPRNEEREVSKEGTQVTATEEKPAKRSFFSHVISGVSGGVLVAVMGGFMLVSDVLPGYENNAAPSTQTESASTAAGGSANVVQTGAATDGEELEAAIQEASKAVVGVKNIQQSDMWSESQAAGTGSGVIYKKEDGKAYVVTNNHVVEGASSVEVVMPDDTTVNAKILGTDPLTDLAVLQIDGSSVDKVISLGSSDELAIGETAIAIGNPLGLEFAGSVTRGIISGLDRSVETDINKDGSPDWISEVIQTDAAINPGNSGGALVNSNGELIGINSMKIARNAVEGIGFAIPIDYAKPIIDQLETDGEVTRPFVGISAMPLSQVPAQHKQETLNLPESVENGVVVGSVQAGSPAEKAGLEKYDVITEVNGEAIKNMLDLKKYLYSETETGEKIDISYYKNGEQQSATLTLTESE